MVGIKRVLIKRPNLLVVDNAESTGIIKEWKRVLKSSTKNYFVYFSISPIGKANDLPIYPVNARILKNITGIVTSTNFFDTPYNLLSNRCQFKCNVFSRYTATHNQHNTVCIRLGCSVNVAVNDVLWRKLVQTFQLRYEWFAVMPVQNSKM